jgi:Fe2+ or Zn2+ uptake regulation protein
MEKKLTDKQEKILNILKEDFNGTAFAEDVVTKTEGLTIQSVRATLSSLATKNLVSKNKEARGEKMLTKYTVIVAE